MIIMGPYEKCRVYLERHKIPTGKLEPAAEKNPCVTISREAGAGADVVGVQLVNYLTQFNPEDSTPWTYFDKNLISRVLEDHELPDIVTRFMYEDKFSNISAVVHELLGSPVSQWTTLHKMTESILQIARMGNSVIVGRGSTIITNKLRNVFHVRLIAPYDDRKKHITELFGYSEKEAADYIKKEDTARKNYFKQYYQKNIDDPCLYHMILNTSLLGYNLSAELIGEAVINMFRDKFK